MYRVAIAGVLAGLLSACTISEQPTTVRIHPFQYFSYLNGDDIRRDCVQGGDYRYRLVYNALYEQQVRTYDILQPYETKSGIQETRVFARGSGAELVISAEGVAFGGDAYSNASINYEGLLKLDEALISSGFEQDAEEGLKLHSDEFYWIAMVCREGAFKYYAWTKENADIEALPFLEALSPADETGIEPPEVKEPVFQDYGARDQQSRRGKGYGYFMLEVGQNGLIL